MSNCYLVSLAFFVKLAPMVLLLACVAWDYPMPCGKPISPTAHAYPAWLKA